MKYLFSCRSKNKLFDNIRITRLICSIRETMYKIFSIVSERWTITYSQFSIDHRCSLPHFNIHLSSFFRSYRVWFGATANYFAVKNKYKLIANRIIYILYMQKQKRTSWQKILWHLMSNFQMPNYNKCSLTYFWWDQNRDKSIEKTKWFINEIVPLKLIIKLSRKCIINKNWSNITPHSVTFFVHNFYLNANHPKCLTWEIFADWCT